MMQQQAASAGQFCARPRICARAAAVVARQRIVSRASKPGAVTDLVAHPLTGLSAIAGFALIASNVPALSVIDPNEPAQQQPALQQLLASSGAAQAAAPLDAAASASTAASTNSILQLDEAIHGYVATHTSEAFRHMADLWISDAFITAGVVGWIACTAACLVRAPRQTAGPLAAAWACYYATCGAVGHADPLLVDALKHFWARARPSELHHTFSFPSGHTSAAVFIVGGLLSVLLPLTLQLWSAQQAPGTSSSTSTSSSSSNTSSSTSSSSSTPSSLITADATILAVWSSAWVVTATGRILSESHWLSDTLSGGLLAVASVSGLAWCSRLLLPATNSSSSSSGVGDVGGGDAAPASILNEGEQ